MPTSYLPPPLDEWGQTLKNALVSAWATYTSNSLTDEELAEIQERFDMIAISAVITEKIGQSSDQELERRIHKTNLTILAGLFARELFYASGNGVYINDETISRSQQRMKNSGSCSIYPCV
jgi:hypothetical protein